MAKCQKNKSQRSRQKRRHGLIPIIKAIAAVLYWLVSFALMLLQLWEYLKS